MFNKFLIFSRLVLHHQWQQPSRASHLTIGVTGNKAKKNPIHRLLYSLSIHHLGRKVSKLLAEEITEVLDLKDWTEERFINIRDVGPTVAQSVMAFFAIPENVELLKTLEILGVNVKQTEADKREVPVTEGAFVGKTILFTGTLTQMSRNEAKAQAKAIGAKLVSGVSSKLDIFIGFKIGRFTNHSFFLTR